jgi:hypothetical protein
MARRTYRTAQGKTVDIEAIKLANEEVIAVGNMNVNARGDELGPGGQVVKNRNQVMKEKYAVHTMTPTEGPVGQSSNRSEGNE